MNNFTLKKNPVKVIEKKQGVIEVWPQAYKAVRNNDGQEIVTERYLNCLHFIYGHNMQRV